MFRNRTSHADVATSADSSRRSFLRKIGGGLAIGLTAKLGLAQSVSAYNY
jgi:hypothetical protein